jgi:hypothetical protein
LNLDYQGVNDAAGREQLGRVELQAERGLNIGELDLKGASTDSPATGGLAESARLDLLVSP